MRVEDVDRLGRVTMDALGHEDWEFCVVEAREMAFSDHVARTLFVSRRVELSDGIAHLDPVTLIGVVCHEVAHIRYGSWDHGVGFQHQWSRLLHPSELQKVFFALFNCGIISSGR